MNTKSMHNIIVRFIINVNYFLFGQNCFLCKQSSRKSICHYCLKCIPPCEEIRSIVASDNMHVMFHSVKHYDYNARFLLKHYKYHFYLGIGSVFANFLNKYINQNSVFNDVDCVVTIPIHWHRNFKRGFNQVDYIVKQSVLQPLLLQVSKRISNTKQLSKIKKSQRFDQMKNAFHHTKPVSCNHLLIIDDVITTGATVQSYIDSLLSNSDNKIKKITVLTIFKA